MTPRIILPADTTVTVGDTLWWGVEGEEVEYFGATWDIVLDGVAVPPEWQALTEACATCDDDFGWAPGWRSTEPFAEAPERCPDCHEGRRSVEVVTVGQAPTYNDDGEVTWERCDTHCTRCTRIKCCWCNSPKSLGRAVIDGDWVPIVDFYTCDLSDDVPHVCVSHTGITLFGPNSPSQDITLHGHADPGGYAARFEVIA